MSESPGSWRDKEFFGLGFGIEGYGGGIFTDFAINSTFQIHIFSANESQEAKSLSNGGDVSDFVALDRKAKGDTVSTYTSISGLSLRIFPIDSSCFFFGLVGNSRSISF